MGMGTIQIRTTTNTSYNVEAINTEMQTNVGRAKNQIILALLRITDVPGNVIQDTNYKIKNVYEVAIHDLHTTIIIIFTTIPPTTTDIIIENL